MASANMSLSIEQFSCSICLEIFTDPVSTPCGHNYCKSCIKAYWATSAFSQCPLCKETFHGVPELQVNTEFRDMLEIFLRTMVACEDSGPLAEPGKVPCDICHGVKREALKSCLVCLASYCNTHLEPHHTVQALKWHKLIDPVANLEDRVCRKHNKMLEFFCRNDLSCVCIVCLRDDHMTHEVISLEEEAKERKTKVKDLKRQVDHTLSEKSTMAKQIQSSMMHGPQKMERMKANITKAFASLAALIETKKTKLIELLEEKQKAAEKTDEAFLRQLQIEIFNNNQTSAKLEELTKTVDDFRLLQDLPSIPSSSNTDFPPRAQRQLDLEKVKRVVAKVKETLTEEMDNIIREVSLAETEETAEEPMHTQRLKVFNDELGKIQRKYAVNVTLEPNTAHPSLIISEDRKQVKDGGMERKVPDTPTRFDFFHFVFGNEGLSSGRFYYEVLVKGQTGWEVGVARESISKKGVDLSLSPENGCWTLGSYWGCWQANTNPPISLALPKKPKKVGVFVDYEGGLVSFYNVDERTMLYSFKGCAFTASVPHLKKATGLKVYTGTTAKTRIYPLFRPGLEKGSDSAPLQITPV